MSSTYFTHAEAESKLGKTIRSKVPFYQVTINSTGKVIESYKIGSEYGITIQWDNTNIFDGFSKDDYEKFLEEV